jgi:Kef-type K+ transport system membrane component KefB
MENTMTVVGIGGQLSLFTLFALGSAFVMSRTPGMSKYMPKVVLWMILGPVLGTFAPDAFSPKTRLIIDWIGFFAVQSFGLTTGMHLNIAELRTQGWKILTLGISSFVFAFAFAYGISGTFIRMYPHIFEGYDVVQLRIISGIFAGVTALPVLSAILNLLGIIKTPLARVNIGMATLHDFILWPVVGVLLAMDTTGHGTGSQAWHGLTTKMTLIILYLVCMVCVVRPALTWLERFIPDHAFSLRSAIVGHIAIPLRFLVVLPVLVMSCFVTHALHLHALLGAVVCGVILPESYKRRTFWLEPYTLHYFLPFFIIGAGLGVSLTTLSPEVWMIFGRLVFVNIAGQLIGTLFFAWLLGFSFPVACAITSFMTCKGIVELALARTLYDGNKIPVEMYISAILMAIFLTAITAPIASFVLRFVSDNDGMGKPGAPRWLRLSKRRRHPQPQ